MPSTPSPEYCSKSKQASEHPVLSSSSALNLRKGSRDRGSQNKTSSRIAEHTQTHFDNVKSTPSNNMRLRKYIPCSPDQNPRKTNLGTELSGMTPSSSSHLFFRTRTNMGEVVLSPGNTWRSPPEQRLYVGNQQVCLSSDPDVEGILKSNENFMRFVGHTKQHAQMRIILRHQSSARPTPGVGELIEFGLQMQMRQPSNLLC